jgi:aconitate hydratase
VGQVVLGGDSGATLRDMLAAALLLKSKRVPSRLDLLVAPSSRQVLEVLAQSGALVDLVATGARIVEPDHRVVSGAIYPPPPGTVSMRTADPEPRVPGAPSFVVASAETLAYAVATGTVGDPRSFKRPVRVTIPRALPTDDVLILRDKKGAEVSAKKAPALPTAAAWKGPLTLDVSEGLGRGTADRVGSAAEAPPKPGADTNGQSGGTVLVLSTLDEVRALVNMSVNMGVNTGVGTAHLRSVRAVVAPFMPSTAVAAFASEGIAAFTADAGALESVKGQKSLSLPAPSSWGDTVAATFGKSKIDVSWAATGVERTWTHAGTARAPAKGSK